MRSVGLAYLLWFFGGPLGVHRFYCERIGTGILWFFTGGLFLIGWIVDFFLIPDMVHEANAKTAAEFQAVHPPNPPVAAYYHTPPTPPPAPRQNPQPADRIVYCTQCGRSMRVPETAGGYSYACPNCRAVLRIPA